MEVKLICSNDSLNELIKHQIVEPQGKDDFILNSKPNLKGEMIQIPIKVENGISTNESVISKKSKEHKSIEDWYKDFRKAFPIDINKELGKLDEGVSLRSGKKDKIISKIKEYANDGYELETIVNAVKYEVWFRTNQSKKTGENKLEFMQRMGAWINNTENLNSMIERMLESNDFKKHMSNEGKQQNTGGSESKVKLV